MVRMLRRATALLVTVGALLAIRAADGVHAEGAPAARGAMAADAFDGPAFGRALFRTAGLPHRDMAGARIVLVPHHWPAGELIVQVLRDVAHAGPGPGVAGGWRRVVLLGPDHRKAGARAVVTTARDWSTPYGVMPADAAAVADLLRGGQAVADASLLRAEHGVAGLVPALRHFLPGARLLPLAVRGDARAAETAHLAARLAASDRPGTLYVVSVDFAHDVLPMAARRNDAASLTALRSLDAARVRAFGDEHVDARGALATALLLARHIDAERFELLQRRDGSDLAGYAGGPVTSYITGYFAGAPPGR